MVLGACMMESSAKYFHDEFIIKNPGSPNIPVTRIELFMEYFFWLIPCSIFLTICALTRKFSGEFMVHHEMIIMTALTWGVQSISLMDGYIYYSDL
jgi:hypothetical protein